jgi:hypothetical protein
MRIYQERTALGTQPPRQEKRNANQNTNTATAEDLA